MRRSEEALGLAVLLALGTVFPATAASLSLSVDEHGAVSVTTPCGVFTQLPPTQTVRRVEASPSHIRVSVFLSEDDALLCDYRVENDAEVSLRLSAPTNMTLHQPVCYPPGWRTEKGDVGIYPFGEGMAYPVDDPEVVFPRERYSFANGMGVSMGFFGLARGEVHLMTGIRKGLHAELRLATNGCHTAGVAWRSVGRFWGENRELRFIFGRSLGEVAGRYRVWRERLGGVRTLAEKAKTNPLLKNFAGTADVWLWDDNTQNRLYNWPLVKESAPRDVRRIADEMKARGMDRVLWNSFEGETAETCGYLKKLGYLVGTYECLRDVFHPGLLSVANPSNFVRAARFLPYADKVTRINQDGTFANAWSIPDKSGKMHPMHALCDMMGLEMCKCLIAPECAAIGYNSRLMDVQACGGPTACFSKKHPCTLAQALEALRDEHRWLCDEQKLVIGVEVGGEYLVDAYHYSEGLTSCPHEFRKELCWRFKDRALYGADVPERTRTVLHNPRYRIPLWELVYHDCTVSYYYWADSTLMYPELTRVKDLFCQLYGLPPIYSMNVATWNRLKDEVAASYRRATPVARQTMFVRMTDFAYLSPDHLVQRTRFENGVEVIANFRNGEMSTNINTFLNAGTK